MSNIQTKIVLNPLDAKTVRVLADLHGITVDLLISNLIREEAAIEITNWRAPAAQQSAPSAVQNVSECPDGDH